MSLNRPEIKVGLIASSRDNFSEDLSRGARDSVYELAIREGLAVYRCDTLVEDEQDAAAAIADIKKANCNAMAVLLGNFGPETPETLLAKMFDAPVMYIAASEDSEDKLYGARRDSYCGMLNCSYNLELRNCRAYIPFYPIGTPKELVTKIKEFIPVARAALALKSLKIISFGPRPSDFFACNAPIKPLYNLDIEIQENSELDLLEAFILHDGDDRIADVAAEMRAELGEDRYPETLPKMAQYELTLLDWIEGRKGAGKYAALANKCWPAFQRQFGFLPCYVHGRLMASGIPVGCETDIYGALSEYIGLCVSGRPVAILDVNNNIPADVYKNKIEGAYPYKPRDLFMGFHCGNAGSDMMAEYKLTYKMNRKEPYAPETGRENNRGTLEGRLRPGEISCFRLHSTADGKLQSYIARGEILPVELPTYGCYALFGVKEMERFYSYVLLEKHFPHHSAIVYGNHSAALYNLMRYLEVPYIGYNRTGSDRYENENPFI